MDSIANTLQSTMQKHASLLEGLITPSQRRAVASFIQAPDTRKSYDPQSGQIFGILSQMKETFENNLAASQKDETANQKAYEELKAAKEAEIAAGTAQKEQKTEELADTDEKNAQAKEDLEDTKTSLSADEEFLMMLKEKCSMTDGEWNERQKTRQLEMEACSKALAVLSGDDAHDLFSSTFNFVQTSSKAQSARRTAASAVLSAMAKKYNNPRLSTLAYKVKLDAFTEVKKAIDDMVTELAKQQADEQKHKDFCVDEFNSNQLQTEEKVRQKKDLEATIDDLKMTISTLTKEIDTLKSEIGEMQVQTKRAGEDRERQNKEFQQTVADQRATQKLLNKALEVLQGFYGKAAAAAALVEEGQEPAGPPPPAGFSEYKKNAQSGGVMSMIEQIIEDAKAMEADALKSEEDATKAYEGFVKETNASIDGKSNEIVNKSEEKAKAESDLVEAEESLSNTNVELEELSTYNAELHQSCDYVLKNFDVRQTARSEEMEALKQAKAILSGAKFEEFLQRS